MKITFVFGMVFLKVVQTNYGKTNGLTNLRSCKTNTFRALHCFIHILNELLKVGVCFGVKILTLLAQYGLTVGVDGENHRRNLERRKKKGERLEV